MDRVGLNVGEGDGSKDIGVDRSSKSENPYRDANTANVWSVVSLPVFLKGLCFNPDSVFVFIEEKSNSCSNYDVLFYLKLKTINIFGFT